MPDASDVLVFAEGNNQVIAHDPAAVGTLSDIGTLLVSVTAVDSGTLLELVDVSGIDLLKTGTDAFTVSVRQTRLGIDETSDGGTLTDSGSLGGSELPEATDSATLIESTDLSYGDSPTPSGSDTATLSGTGVVTTAESPIASDSFVFWDEQVWSYLLGASIASNVGTGTLTDLGTIDVTLTASDSATLTDSGIPNKSRSGTDTVTVSEFGSITGLITHNDLFALATDVEFQGAGDFLNNTDVSWTLSDIGEVVATLVDSDAGTLADTGNIIGGTDTLKTAADLATFAESVDLSVVVVAVDTATLTGSSNIGLHGLLSGTVTITPAARGSASMEPAPYLKGDISTDSRLDGAVTFLP